MNKSEHTWTGKQTYERVGTGLNQFETVWTSGNQFEPIEAGFQNCWTGLKRIKFYHFFWTCLNNNDNKKYNKDNACNYNSKDNNNGGNTKN